MTLTTKERVTSGFGKPRPAPKTEPIKTRKPKAAAAPKVVKMTTPKPEPKPKTVRVLEDPIDNAKLIWMRAKWAAERQDVRTAKIEAEFENFTTEDAVARVAYAHSLSATAWTDAEHCKAEYTTLRLAAKAAAK